MSAESKFTSKLAEARKNHDSEKHDIFSFVCNEFRDNFDPYDPIIEKSFRKCILKTKNEHTNLQKMENAIRKMVNAGPSQNTTDTVAKNYCFSFNKFSGCPILDVVSALFTIIYYVKLIIIFF